MPRPSHRQTKYLLPGLASPCRTCTQAALATIRSDLPASNLRCTLRSPICRQSRQSSSMPRPRVWATSTGKTAGLSSAAGFIPDPVVCAAEEESRDARSDHTDHIGHLHRSDRPSWEECGSATWRCESVPASGVRAPSHAATLSWSAPSRPRRIRPGFGGGASSSLSYRQYSFLQGLEQE